MMVTGPNLEYAEKEGRQVGELLLQKLIKEHGLFDITNKKYKDFHELPSAKERWADAKENFIKAVTELFIEDAGNGF